MTDTTTQIASIGLPSHNPPEDIAAQMQRTLNLILKDGKKARDMARQLSAVGYPSSTLGDGGSRGTDGTSSTERAAGVMEDKPRPNEWAGVDRALAQAFAAVDMHVRFLDRLIKNINQYGSTLDPVPVGTGECAACGMFCRPDGKRPGNRLRSGLCPTDYRAFLRAGQPNRQDWIHARRKSITDDNGVLHTPEPDHDIDLSSERLSP